MTIGVLAVQGAFIEHERMLSRLGAESVELRQRQDITPELSGIILPGGESTAQGKMLRELDMYEPLKTLIQSGVPTLGTCAGMILLAETLSGGESAHLGTLPVSVHRNAYGRQLDSFVYSGEIAGIGRYPMVFIRAPFVEQMGNGCQPLAEVNGRIVAVQYKSQLALAFHPELTDDPRLHQRFLSMITG